MARTLAHTVTLNADDGTLHRFLAGTVPPDWAADKIPNPRAWGDDVDADTADVPDPDHPLHLGGPGLTKVADKMGASGDRMVSEAKKNLRNLDAGYKEVVASIGQTVEKGEDDKTKTTRKGHALRLDDEEKAAKDKKAVWDGSANVFIDDEKARAAAAKEADRVIRSSWGLSSDYILSETAKVVTAHRAQAAALATIVDGMDGVYGSSTTAAPAVEAVGDEVYNAARGAVSLANEFGTIDDQAASVLNNVINLADTLKDGLKGIAAGNLIGAVGALAGILGTMFSDGPQEKARRELILKNTQRLQELKDRMGELLNISTPGGKITKFQGLNEDELIATSLDIGPNGLGQKVGVGQVGQFLAKNGLSLTDMRQMAADFGIDLGDDGKNFTVAGVRQFFKVLNSGQFVGFGNDSFAGKLDKNDFLNSILGVEGDGALASMAELFKDPETGSSAFASVFDGVNLADGVDDEERALMRGRLGVLAQRFASGAIGSAELGGLSNTDAQQVFTRISDMLGTPSAATGAAPAGAGAGTGSGPDSVAVFASATSGPSGVADSTSPALTYLSEIAVNTLRTADNSDVLVEVARDIAAATAATAAGLADGGVARRVDEALRLSRDLTTVSTGA